MTAPTARLIHNLARSGGTIVGKCLGAMDGVYLLSEINPRGTGRFDPLDQADRWFGLLTDDDRAQAPGLDFADAIALIDERVRERGGYLVIRDWNHLDFVGVPYAPGPAGRLALADALADRFDVRSISLVRHPIDQVESFFRAIRGAGEVPIDAVLSGARKFAEAAVATGFVRYEDFAADPDRVLGEICAALDVPFDAGYRTRWQAYATITGDTTGSRGGLEAIRPVPRKAVPPHIMDYLLASEDYRQTCALLGYDTGEAP